MRSKKRTFLHLGKLASLAEMRPVWNRFQTLCRYNLIVYLSLKIRLRFIDGDNWACLLYWRARAPWSHQIHRPLYLVTLHPHHRANQLAIKPQIGHHPSAKQPSGRAKTQTRNPFYIPSNLFCAWVSYVESDAWTNCGQLACHLPELWSKWNFERNYKIHISETSIFTKFTFLKSQNQGNFWIKSGFYPSVLKWIFQVSFSAHRLLRSVLRITKLVPP